MDLLKFHPFKRELTTIGGAESIITLQWLTHGAAHTGVYVLNICELMLHDNIRKCKRVS